MYASGKHSEERAVAYIEVATNLRTAAIYFHFNTLKLWKTRQCQLASPCQRIERVSAPRPPPPTLCLSRRKLPHDRYTSHDARGVVAATVQSSGRWTASPRLPNSHRVGCDGVVQCSCVRFRAEVGWYAQPRPCRCWCSLKPLFTQLQTILWAF